MVGLLQATEVLKLLLGIGEPLLGRFLVFDALGVRFRELQLRKSPSCPICSAEPTQKGLVEYTELCGDAPRAQGTGTTAGAPATAEDWQRLELDVHELRRWQEEGRDLQLLDVRTPVEARIASLPGATLIPVQELHQRFGELDPSRPVVAFCHFGPRSQHATVWLRGQGFARVLSLAGGIDAWSREIDPALPRY
jgi:adenylyltransferase/sulfurtransferase